MILKKDFVLTVSNSFSAWENSNSGKAGATVLNPYRVEYPLLWYLHENKIII